jgi:hypothetical protein
MRLLRSVLFGGLALAACKVFALDPVTAGVRGELIITLSWDARIVAGGEFADLTVIKRSATLTCPVVASDLEDISPIDGPNAAQMAAFEEVGAAARKQVESVPASEVARMQALEQQMRSCRRGGGSEQACGMQIMQAMQSDPALLEQMGRMGSDRDGAMARAERKAADAAGRFQPWFNEGCRGQMQVDDSRKLDDPTLPGEEPTVRTTGTRPIDTSDTLVTVETDLEKSQTRYLLIAPEAAGFEREAGYGMPAARITASALPVGHVIAGPFRGPIGNGRHEFRTEGGSVRIDWTYRRLH